MLAVPRRTTKAAPPPDQPVGADAVAALKGLAELGAAQDFIATSSGELASRLGVSQQTAARKIVELVQRGLVERRVGVRVQQVRVTARGKELLRREFETLRAILEGTKATLPVRGKVAAGLGEGGWYISRKGYQVQFERLLGFVPWPGTLNLNLEGTEVEKLAELRAREGLLAEEFVDEGRTFGAVKCFRATLNGLDTAVVVPVRGHHAQVLEVVAPVRLRDALKLRDGDEVTLHVSLA